MRMNASTIVAWRVGPRLCWIQTTSPRNAKRLRQRRDTWIVAHGETRDYLRTFAIKRPLWFVRRLVDRYERKERTTNSTFSSPRSTQNASKLARKVETAHGRKSEKEGR